MLKAYVDWLGPALLDASACPNSSAIDYQRSTVSRRRHVRQSDRVDLSSLDEDRCPWHLDRLNGAPRHRTHETVRDPGYTVIANQDKGVTKLVRLAEAQMHFGS